MLRYDDAFPKKSNATTALVLFVVHSTKIQPMFVSRFNLLRVFSIKLVVISRFSFIKMDDSKRSLVAESAARQLKMYGYESKQSGDENYETFRKITYSEEGLKLQELIQGRLQDLDSREAPVGNSYQKLSAQQHKELQTVLPVIWDTVKELTDKREDEVRTVLLMYGSSVLCIEVCRPINPDLDAPSPDQYGEQLFVLEKEAVRTLKQLTGRQLASTAVELMALFGVRDSQKEEENLMLYASVATSQDGEDLRNLVRKYLNGSTAKSPFLMMKGIVPFMWGTILETAKEDENMQFVLMVCGAAILVTEIEKDFSDHDLSGLQKMTAEFIKEQKFLPPTFLASSTTTVSKLFSSLTSLWSSPSKKD